MSEKDLEAGLAQRVRWVALQEPQAWALVSGNGSEFGPLVYLAIARECLRQMRWAYSEGFCDASGRNHSGRLEEDRYLGVTEIAPDDWKPE